MKKSFVGNALFTFIFALTTFAAEPQIWTVDRRSEILRGEAKGVSVTETGAVTLAPRIAELFNTGQSYVWSSAADSAGNVFLGTGGDGKIFKVDAAGKGAIFADTNELNVSALAVGSSGELYAGTSPDGKVYRISANGAVEIYFEPKEKYIWSLEVLGDGSLAVGTGENGRIYKVKTANIKPETALLFDTSETHIISLAHDKRDNLYAGTDGGGLVLRFAPDGKPFALLDSPLREIHDIAVAADDSIYVLALSDAASASKTIGGTVTGTTADGGTVTAVITSTEAPTVEAPPKSRYDLSAAKSAVYRLLPDGGSDVIWNSASVTAFSIAANPNTAGALLGTSDKGRIYSVTNDGRETLLLQSDEGQISTLLTRGSQVFATSSNQGKLYRFGTETVAEGSYESTVLDARTSAAWGRIWWRSSGAVTLQTRTGNTDRPNETWSDWSQIYADQTGAQISSPKAKYLQWRAILKAQTSAATLNEVSVSYLGRNIAPEVLSIQILPTGVGLLSNPPIQIDPNIENSGLDITLFGLQNVVIPPRRAYQRGARALQWTAEDRNGDRLAYDLYFRRTSETAFKLLRQNLRENFFTIDGAALTDGQYIFKVIATDAPSNPAGLSLSGERTSETVEIDNAAPTVLVAGAPQINGDTTRVSFEASDAASFLTRAEYSVNGGDWTTVYAADGISDAQKERYTIEIPVKTAGEYTISLRVFDVNGNVGSASVTARK